MSSTRSLNIPASKSTVQVSIVDTTFDAKFPAAYFMGPPIKGFDELTAVAYAFLVKHVDSVGEERSILFDLGTPKDVVNDFPPKVAEWFMGMGFMRVEKYVSEILEENNVALDSIEAIIWRCFRPQDSSMPLYRKLTSTAATHTWTTSAAPRSSPQPQN
jgi:hypothetical protein